jgi:hypothetical protein
MQKGKKLRPLVISCTLWMLSNLTSCNCQPSSIPPTPQEDTKPQNRDNTTSSSAPNPPLSPTNPAATPTNPSSIPTNSAATPTNPPSTPTNPAATPTNPSSTPTDSATIPANPSPSSTPTSPVTTPANSSPSSTPTGPATTPINQTPTPPAKLSVTDEMIQAARKYSTSLVSTLEKLKNHEQVDINQPIGLHKTTPLQLAASIPGRVGADMVQLFLYKGSDPGLLGTFSKQQPLYKAVEQGNAETVKVLIAAMQEKGYNLDFENVYSKDGNLKRTAYQQAARQYAASSSPKTAYKEIMDLLKAAGADTTL